MLGVEAVAEGMADHVVGHHPTMPGVGRTSQAVVTTRCLEDSLHVSIMTIVPCLCKTLSISLRHGQRRMEGAKLRECLIASTINSQLRNGHNGNL